MAQVPGNLPGVPDAPDFECDAAASSPTDVVACGVAEGADVARALAARWEYEEPGVVALYFFAPFDIGACRLFLLNFLGKDRNARGTGKERRLAGKWEYEEPGVVALYFFAPFDIGGCNGCVRQLVWERGAGWQVGVRGTGGGARSLQIK